MKHALMYQGAYETNYPALKPGATSYVATDGATHPLPSWPGDVDGVRAGYMEKSGKKFMVVRLQFDSQDVIIKNPIPLDGMRHLGSRRLSPEPTFITDELTSDLMDDLIAANPDQRDELSRLLNRVNQVRREKRA